jgi:hypothetical protein
MGSTRWPDPLRVVWDALYDNCCLPHGPAHQFEALCPSHDDRHSSLSVGVGVDGRALLHCHAGCSTADVLAELGLSWPDLFVDGEQERHVELPRRRRHPDVIVNLALDEPCPSCRRSDQWMVLVDRDQGEVSLKCAAGCTQAQILLALGERERAA